MLGRHHVIGAAIGLPRDHRHLRASGLGEGKQQLRAVLDDAAMLLRHAGQKSRHVDEGDDRNVEAIAEAHEARSLPRGVAVKHARQHHRLVGDKPNGCTFQAAEAGDHVARERLADLEEIAFVGDLQD